jgi:hypothetical protein
MGGPYEGEVSIDLDGQTYTGHYRVDHKGLLHVSYGPYRKSTQHRGPDSPKPMARILLRELVAEARRDGAA